MEKFKGKEIDVTWLSKTFKKGKYLISNSSGAQFEYDNEEKRDKDYEKILKIIDKEVLEIHKRRLLKKLNIKV